MSQEYYFRGQRTIQRKVGITKFFDSSFVEWVEVRTKAALLQLVQLFQRDSIDVKMLRQMLIQVL